MYSSSKCGFELGTAPMCESAVLLFKTLTAWWGQFSLALQCTISLPVANCADQPDAEEELHVLAFQCAQAVQDQFQKVAGLD
jgi:hypothetical protein